MPNYTDIEADLKIANAEVEQLRADLDSIPRCGKYIITGTDADGNPKEERYSITYTPNKKELDELRAENAKLREENRWIPVSERLPEEGEPVLVHKGYSRPDISCYRRFQNGVFWHGRGKEVTHWMPLPSAPEKGE